MWVIDIEASPPRLRGRLSRWAVEVRAGLYVGATGVKARDAIWKLVCQNLGSEANAVLVYPARNSQGFEIRTEGKNRREIVDVEGLWLAKFLPLEEARVPWDEPVEEGDWNADYLEQP